VILSAGVFECGKYFTLLFSPIRSDHDAEFSSQFLIRTRFSFNNCSFFDVGGVVILLLPFRVGDFGRVLDIFQFNNQN
jgi:hypothetical protein